MNSSSVAIIMTESCKKTSLGYQPWYLGLSVSSRFRCQVQWRCWLWWRSWSRYPWRREGRWRTERRWRRLNGQTDPPATYGCARTEYLHHGNDKQQQHSFIQFRLKHRDTGIDGSRTKWYGQNGTDKMVPIESSINQAIQLPLTMWFSSLIPLPLRPI